MTSEKEIANSDDDRDRNGNSNCMRGLECPECGESEMVRVQVNTLMELFDNGHGDYFDCEWDEGSYMECSSCDYNGTAKDFRIDEEKEMTKVMR